MSLDLATLDHNCNVVRRQVEDEFKNLTALFIVHNSNQRTKTIIDKRNTIMAKPHGRKVYDFITLTTQNKKDQSEFMGIIVHNSRFLNLFKKRHYTAVFFVNADEFAMHDNAKHQLYHLAWHGLNLLNDIRLNPNDHKIKGSAELVQPKTDKILESQNNLMADVFGAILMEAENHDNYIQVLAEKRGRDTLNPTKYFIGELYPYPMAYEACQLIYDDLKSTIDKRLNLMGQVMDLSIEVAGTYGKTLLRQWLDFSKPTQEMAWLGYSPEQILGQAIYASDDTHVRATAYVIAESMNIDPQTENEWIPYNPFLDQATNKRQHDRFSDELFQKTAKYALEDNDPQVLSNKAIHQNRLLRQGHVSGWCGSALLECSRYMANNKGCDLESLTEEYFKHKTQISWSSLLTISKIVLSSRRRGLSVSKDYIFAALEKQKGDFTSIMNCLKDPEIDMDRYEKDEPIHISGITQFMSDSNISKNQSELRSLEAAIKKAEQ